MRIGVVLPGMLGGLDRPTILDWARRIEADGYDTISFGERISYRNLELFTVLGAAAAVTERVSIAASVVILPMHPEVWVAKQTATLDVVSGGRAVLGVGVGGRLEDYRALRQPTGRRWDRLDEQVARLRPLWSGLAPGGGLDPVGPKPVHPIPILSAGMGPRSMARSARWADGIDGFELDPSEAHLRATATRAVDAWTETGRPDRPQLVTSWWFALGDDPVQQLQDYARHYLGVFGADLADSLARSCTAAGPDAVLASVEAARAAGYDEIRLVPTTTDLTELDRLSALLH